MIHLDAASFCSLLQVLICNRCMRGAAYLKHAHFNLQAT